MRPWLPIAAILCSLAACHESRAARGLPSASMKDQPQQQQQQQVQGGLPVASPAALEPAPAFAARSRVSDEASDAASGAELPGLGTRPADSTAPSMIIRTGNAMLQVDTLEPAITHLHQLATRLGGYVANSSVQSGRQQLRQATLELKIPARQFDDLTAALGSLGKVESVNVAAEDVGEEYTDIAARITNAERLEQRLIDLLATRTGKLPDVLAVERELARVRETIERYEGRLRYLRTHAELSSLSITVHEPPPLIADHPGRSVIGEAFVRAWRNFVALIAAVIASLGVVAPVVAAALAVGLGWRRWRSRPARAAAATR